MTPESWTDVLNYVLLATGAAMAVGTGLAMWRHHQTGIWPGQPMDDAGNPIGDVSMRAAWIKVVLGTVLAVWGLAGLTSQSVIGLS